MESDAGQGSVVGGPEVRAAYCLRAGYWAVWAGASLSSAQAGIETQLAAGRASA